MAGDMAGAKVASGRALRPSPLAKFHGREPKLDFHKCLLLALSGDPTRTDECPLLGGKADMTQTGRYVRK